MDIAHWGVGNALEKAGCRREDADTYDFWGMLIEDPMVGEVRESIVHPIVTPPKSSHFYTLVGDKFAGSKRIDFEGADRNKFMYVDWGKECTKYCYAGQYDTDILISGNGIFWRTNLGYNLQDRQAVTPYIASQLRGFLKPIESSMGYGAYIAALGVFSEGMRNASNKSRIRK